jgi:hypothetical protein
LLPPWSAASLFVPLSAQISLGAVLAEARHCTRLLCYCRAMRPIWLSGVVATAWLFAGSSVAGTPRPGPPKTVGECRWVHGRFIVANGSGVQRIWIIGTKRIVAIPDGYPVLPEVISDYEGISPADSRGDLFADFHVCALEDSTPGAMQHVNVNAVRRAIYEGRPFPRR